MRVNNGIMEKKTWCKWLPNILTTINMLCGIIVILLLQKEQQFTLWLPPLLIWCGALADALDGYCARRFNATSVIGKYLDSLADILTFGVASTLYFIHNVTIAPPFLQVILPVLFLFCGCFRLARFHADNDTHSFKGLPIPIAGCILVGYTLIYQCVVSVSLLSIVVILLLAILMVATFKWRRF